MDLSTIKNTGNWGNSASRLNENFSKVGTEVDKLKYAAYNSKLYASEALLKQAIPSPSVGDWAIVGDSIPGEIYRCDTDGEWTATGQTGGGYGMEVTEKHVTEQYVTEVHNEYTGDIVNNPDDEDLISEELAEGGKVLKLADKAYNASAFSGLGRVYLRKNVTASKNILTQAMISNANTRYIIQYDYDLNGQAITIPEGCTLDFQGGSLSNGEIVFQNTTLSSTGDIIINCKVSGSITNSEIWISWFNAKSRTAKNIYYPDVFEQVFNIIKEGKYILDGCKYEVIPISLKSNIEINLNGSEVKQKSGTVDTPVFAASNNENIKIYNGVINGNKENVTGNNANGIRFITCANFEVNNIKFNNVKRGCIICWNNCTNFRIYDIEASECGFSDSISTLMESYNCRNFILERVSFINSYGVGLYPHSCSDFEIRNALLSDISTDNGLTTEDCQRFKLDNIVADRNSNVGIEINSSVNFKLTNSEAIDNVHHNVMISTFKEGGNEQSLLGVVENLTTDGASGDYNGLKITSGTNLNLINCSIKDNIFITKQTFSSELITLSNVKSPLLYADYTDNLVLLNCKIDRISGNSTPVSFPAKYSSRFINENFSGSLAVGEEFKIIIPGNGNVATASGTLDLLTLFSENYDQNCKNIISFKLINNTLSQETISRIQGDVSRELTLTNVGNELVLTNNTNVHIRFILILSVAYI